MGKKDNQDGKIVKMQEDFSDRVDAVIPVQQKLAQEGKLAEAIENLLALEKQTRQAEDYLSTSKLALAIIRMCFERKDWNALLENLQVLAKRRGQLRSVIQDFVREAMTYLDKVEFDIKMKLLDTLRSITEGKIFVEIERARLSRIYAKIKEDEGKIGEAADILQEIQVETFGQMDKVEKTDFILEQIRLVLAKGDAIRAQILSNKISKKFLNDPDLQDVKLRFFTLMIKMYTLEGKYLDICRSYQAMYDTPKVQADEPQLLHYLKMMVVYACLSKYDNEQSDLAHRIQADKNLPKIPLYKKLLDLFLTQELLSWPQPDISAELSKIPEFGTDVKNQYWIDIHKRVIEHNIRVLEAYYSKMTMKRASQLLGLPEADAEKFISEMVVSKAIFAKIDRPKGIISFRRRKEPNDFLNEWAQDINGLLDLLEKSCHLIQRENMVYKIDQTTRA